MAPEAPATITAQRPAPAARADGAEHEEAL